MAAITYDGVSKVYDDGTRAVEDFDLEIEDGEFMVLVGPSGCGKTCLLYTSPSPRDLSTSRMPSSA